MNLADARSRGIREGLFEGNRLWLAIGVAAWAARALQWAWTRRDEVVYRGVLAPGEQLTITTTPPRQSRRFRRDRGQ